MAWQPHLRSAFPHAYQGYACVSCVPGSPRYPHPLTRLCAWRLPPARLLVDPGVPGSTFHTDRVLFGRKHRLKCCQYRGIEPTQGRGVRTTPASTRGHMWMGARTRTHELIELIELMCRSHERANRRRAAAPLARYCTQQTACNRLVAASRPTTHPFARETSSCSRPRPRIRRI